MQRTVNRARGGAECGVARKHNKKWAATVHLTVAPYVSRGTYKAFGPYIGRHQYKYFTCGFHGPAHGASAGSVAQRSEWSVASDGGIDLKMFTKKILFETILFIGNP